MVRATGSPPQASPPTCYNQTFPMADILPFRALRYNLAQVEAAQVVSQPYDKITSAMQERYYATSPYNLIRIILGRRDAEDNPARSVYTRAAEYGRVWRNHGILVQDDAPSVYVYRQTFSAPPGACPRSGAKANASPGSETPGSETILERRGFIALGRVEDYSAKVVFRHEQTLSKPKADRLELLRATRAHYEQLFLLYEDSGKIEALLSPQAANTPAIDVTDEYGVEHRVWKVSDPAVIIALQKQMADKKLVIADGHHRYETALNYRNECRAVAGSSNPQANHEFVMMTLINMNDPGLVILPTHRVVHSLASFSAEEFQKSCAKFFEIEETKVAIEPGCATSLLRERGRAGTALLAVSADRAFVLHSPKPAAAQFLAGLSPRQKALDVVQLHKCILEGILQLSEESIRNQQNLSYVREASEAVARVRNRSANMAFLMNPCPVEQVRDVAFAGEVMPQKSTDFYPKLLSGLTAYALD